MVDLWTRISKPNGKYRFQEMTIDLWKGDMMVSSFEEAVELAGDVLGSSPVLQRLGYETSIRELIEETQYLPRRYEFILKPSVHRRLVIRFCYQRDGVHYFTVELSNTEKTDSFLLEEWIQRTGIKSDLYPFILSSYAGTERERLVGFVEFLDRQLGAGDLFNILMGRDWQHVPYNWGALK